MQITEFDLPVLPSLTRLINQQTANLPPGRTLTDEQVERIIAQGGMLWRLHYPDNRELFTSRTVCILEKGEVVAAAQWHLPTTNKGICSLLWLVADPKSPKALRTLLHLIGKQTSTNGCGSVEQVRFSFGIGWSGIPESWTHVLEGLREAGYVAGETWMLMIGDTSVYQTLPVSSEARLKFYWNMNRPALEWGLTAYEGEILAGECQVWGVPPHLEDCPGVSDWASMEWIEVKPNYRRDNVGQRLIAEQMRFHTRHGVKHLMVWVDQENLAARKLYESMQFVYGEKLIAMHKPR